ncbi:hypothetical protein VU02_03715, partial [Desulfobulbus sp. N2]|nr:hypothetical protein [Desulfobulbus sp. N2]
LGFDSEFIKLHGASSLLYVLFPLQNRGLLFFILEKEDKNDLQAVKGGGSCGGESIGMVELRRSD